MMHSKVLEGKLFLLDLTAKTHQPIHLESSQQQTPMDSTMYFSGVSITLKFQLTKF